MNWLIVFAAVLLGLFLLVQVRVGVALEYKPQEFVAEVRFGFLSYRILPAKKRDEKKKKGTAATSAEKKPLTRFSPYIPCVLRTGCRVLRQLRVDKLDLNIVVGGQDPADTAVRYGQLNAAVGSVWGPLGECVRVKQADVHLDVDFDAGRTRTHGALSVSWRLSQLLSALLYFAHDVFVIAYRTRATNKQEGMVIEHG